MPESPVQNLPLATTIKDRDRTVLEQDNEAKGMMMQDLIRYLFTASDKGGVWGIHIGSSQPAGTQNLWIDTSGNDPVLKIRDESGVWHSLPSIALQPMPGDLNPFYMVSVKAYGADGSGTGDDTESFKTALLENPGRTLYVPKGKYNLTNVVEIGERQRLFCDNGAEFTCQNKIFLKSNAEVCGGTWIFDNGGFSITTTKYGLTGASIYNTDIKMKPGNKAAAIELRAISNKDAISFLSYINIHDLTITGAEQVGIYLNASGASGNKTCWVNALNLNNVSLNGCRNGISMDTDGPGSEVAGNLFNNIQIQAPTSSPYDAGIYIGNARRNAFSNVMIWDSNSPAKDVFITKGTLNYIQTNVPPHLLTNVVSGNTVIGMSQNALGVGSDVVFSPEKSVILQSPNGSKFKVTVNDSGDISASPA